jgi:transcriptional regulator with XRE-family HTH domain
MAAKDIGQQLVTWRKLLGLTAEQVADRAGIARGTLGRLEHGDLGVGLGAVLSVAAGLGLLDGIVNATDPYETDLGRARADQALPQRVRR